MTASKTHQEDWTFQFWSSPNSLSPDFENLPGSIIRIDLITHDRRLPLDLESTALRTRIHGFTMNELEPFLRELYFGHSPAG